MMFVILGGGVSHTQNSHPLHKKTIIRLTHARLHARTRGRRADRRGVFFFLVFSLKGGVGGRFSFSLLSSFGCVDSSEDKFLFPRVLRTVR